MNITAGTEKETVLNSNLTESAFGKLYYSVDTSDQGLIAECAENELYTGNGNTEFHFEKWRFTGTEVEETSGKVLFTGSGFSGRPLLALLDGHDEKLKSTAAYALAECAGCAARRGMEIPANGAGGILAEISNGKIRFLFLPAKIFEFAASKYPKENYVAVQEGWQDKNLKGMNAVNFILAAVCYKVLTGELPFQKIPTDERQADIFDQNYMPLENRINGISKEVSDWVSFSLEYGSKDYIKALKEGIAPEKMDLPYQGLKKELGLNADGIYKKTERKATMTASEFAAQTQKIMQKKAKKADVSRQFRRNTVSIVIRAIIAVIIMLAAHSFYRDSLAKPTSISLTACQTVETFFTGMHLLNVNIMHEMARGREANALMDSISNVYVISKSRTAYDIKTGTLTPETWLFRHDLNTYWQFGITNLQLGEVPEDGTVITRSGNTRFTAPSRKMHPQPLTVENGRKIENNQIRRIYVSYYMLHSEGMESEITVEKKEGFIYVKFYKNRWLIDNLEIIGTETRVPMDEFERNFNKVMAESGNDPIKAVAALRSTYPWLPAENQMHDARIEAETAAADDLL